MLQKIVHIKSVGRFKSCVASGDVTLRRVTLVFAENGRGKTTLCAILRSLLANAPAVVLGRKTLGNPDPPDIHLMIGGASVLFRGGNWSAPFPDIAIFDATYVTENIFAGDLVDTEHRRNLYRVIVGAQGVTLAARVNELDNDIRTKNTEIRDLRTRLQQYILPGMTIEAFVALAEDAAIDTKIAAKVQELQAVQRAAQLRQRAILAPIAVPTFPPSFAELLAKTFANVSQAATTRVAEHVAQHRMEGRGEAWLTQGLSFITDDTCPFCTQNLAPANIVPIYTELFGPEYRALRDQVVALSSQIESGISDSVSASIAQTLLQNVNNAEFWIQYCNFIAPVLNGAETAAEVMRTLREAAKLLLDLKGATPLEPVPPDEHYTQALAGFEALRAAMGEYNSAVAAANAIIESRKRQAEAANLHEVESELARLKAFRARHTDNVKALCATDARLQNERTALETAKIQAREQLDAHTSQVITAYGQRINHYLERVNAGFRITPPTHNYRGGTPNTSYQIVINQHPVDLGDADTPHDRPSFRNTLSAGDKSTLALAFFLAQLEQDPDRARKVIVFDDPFSSQDGFRRNHTVHQIYKCRDNCAQVIVFSHEPGFLKLLWDRVLPADRKTLQLAHVGEENTTIAEWDIERALQARYRADIDVLQRYFSIGEGEPRDVIQKIRPVLEGFCRNLFPAQFLDGDMMGVIVGKIRTAGPSHTLYPIADDLDEINIYCRRYHHAENPKAANEAIDDTELQGYVRRTLSLTGSLL
jgi:wobble nucleotide-excising tRNase